MVRNFEWFMLVFGSVPRVIAAHLYFQFLEALYQDEEIALLVAEVLSLPLMKGE